MKKKLIGSMICPYCRGTFKPADVVEETTTHIEYGFIECNCFKFPIFNGVLLLSLSKGYGGSEEDIQPYVPLQVAAINFISKRDIKGLEEWVGKHIPLLKLLMSKDSLTYVDYLKEHCHLLDKAISQHWKQQLKFEVTGLEGKHQTKNLLKTYYASRFLTKFQARTYMHLADLPLTGSILSLCPGHGVFENLILNRVSGENIVGVDGQILNLFVVKKFINPEGTFICHDVQFPLPFKPEVFDRVFSSTCLPEIPSHAMFIEEAVRVTKQSGWTFFDCVWMQETVARVQKRRHYRVCQNEFNSLKGAHQTFQKSCRGRSLRLAVLGDVEPLKYVDKPQSLQNEHRFFNVLVSEKMKKNTVLGTGFKIDKAERNNLFVSPIYKVKKKNGGKNGYVFEPKSYRQDHDTITIAKDQLGNFEVLKMLYLAGVLTFLPPSFSNPNPLKVTDLIDCTQPNRRHLNSRQIQK